MVKTGTKSSSKSAPKPAAESRTGSQAKPAEKPAEKSAGKSQAKPAAKSGARRFRVLLEKDKRSEATSFRVPLDVPSVFGTRARVPVRGTINGAPYRSSIFPMGGGCHMMVVNRELRAAAGVKGGETISVVMERDDGPRTVEPPADFLRALRASADACETWERLSYTHRREHVRAVEEAKRPETRARRIERSVAMLAAGKKEYR